MIEIVLTPVFPFKICYLVIFDVTLDGESTEERYILETGRWEEIKGEPANSPREEDSCPEPPK